MASLRFRATYHGAVFRVPKCNRLPSAFRAEYQTEAYYTYIPRELENDFFVRNSSASTYCVRFNSSYRVVACPSPHPTPSHRPSMSKCLKVLYFVGRSFRTQSSALGKIINNARAVPSASDPNWRFINCCASPHCAHTRLDSAELFKT